MFLVFGQLLQLFFLVETNPLKRFNIDGCDAQFPSLYNAFLLRNFYGPVIC